MRVLPVIACALIWCGSRTPAEEESAKPSPAVLIEQSAALLGVPLGATMKEAHEKLDRLRVAEKEEPDREREEEKKQKGKGAEREKDDADAGQREFWKLEQTDYTWLVAWADKTGHITQLSAQRRADKLLPFDQIGDLAHAVTHNEKAAAWNIKRPDGSSFRLVAKGHDQQAISIYLLTLPRE